MALSIGAALLCALLPAGASALALPSTWASYMVLEADVQNTLWGTDEPGALVTVSGFGATLNATASAAGAWAVTLPAQPVSAAPQTIAVTSSAAGGGAITLTDVLVGHTYVCSGQSNMQLTVSATYNWMTETQDAAALGATLRIFQVAELDAYAGTTTPQTNLTPSIPWSRASPASIPGMSALCYYFGAELVAKHPGVPIGLLASSWGGTAIQRALRARLQRRPWARGRALTSHARPRTHTLPSLSCSVDVARGAGKVQRPRRAHARAAGSLFRGGPGSAGQHAAAQRCGRVCSHQ